MSDTETLRLARQIKNLKEKTESISLYNYTLSDILLASHPVGEVYISFNSTSPEILFGGTWVSFGAGRVLVGYNSSDSDFNASEKTGGEKTHTLSVNEMPSHRHREYGSNANYALPRVYKYEGTPGSLSGVYTAESHITNGGDYLYSELVGGNVAHNNLQPYVTVYMWKRTA